MIMQGGTQVTFNEFVGMEMAREGQTLTKTIEIFNNSKRIYLTEKISPS